MEKNNIFDIDKKFINLNLMELYNELKFNQLLTIELSFLKYLIGILYRF